MNPTIGRIVLFTLAAAHVDAIKDQRARSEGGQVGNPVSPGMVFPLLITQVWGNQPHSAFNGQLLLDGTDSLWLTSVSISETPKEGSAHWPVVDRREHAPTSDIPPDRPDTTELSHIMADAKREIESLRRRNEVLGAKVETMDLFACVLHTMPASRTEGACVDVAGQLEKAIAGLKGRTI